MPHPNQRHQRVPHLIAQIIYPLIGPVLPPRPTRSLCHQNQRFLPVTQHRSYHIPLLRPYPPPCHIHISSIQIHKKMFQIIIRMMCRSQPLNPPLLHHPSEKFVPQIPRRHLNRHPISLAISLYIALLYAALHPQLLRKIGHKLRVFSTLPSPQPKIHVRHHKRKARQSKQPSHHHRIHTATHRQQCRP